MHPCSLSRSLSPPVGSQRAWVSPPMLALSAPVWGERQYEIMHSGLSLSPPVGSQRAWSLRPWALSARAEGRHTLNPKP